ncbi:MAG: FAD-dependent oxidoreductase [Deltaproteobacteria bacterium]|jgi:nitrite reductase (NADH) large subunit|nr:FAD-dependent oxidoreductase [Deltaproteobacteria bacterium]
MNIVIIGAGIAGISAAETIRQTNPKADVTLFSGERVYPYYRPRLPEVVAGKISPEKIQVHPEEWYREKKLEFRLGETVADVCLDNMQVRGSLGSRLVFDGMLLATGAESFFPKAAADFKLPGIFPVRTMVDAWDLNFNAKKVKKALLLGSGLLGLEIGHALTALGLETHVLERSTRILPFQTTPKSSEKLRGFLERDGMVFHLESEALSADGKERLERVTLRSGEVIETPLMVVSAGVTPNVEIAKTLGLKIDGGIRVNKHMETSVRGIYAAGDCARTPDGKGGLWSIARLEGIAAGRNLAAERPEDRVPYEPPVPSSVLKVAGHDLVASGDIDPDQKLPFAECETESFYRKVVVDRAGLLVGFTNAGTTVGNKELTRALKKTVISPETLVDLEDPDFDFKRLQEA